MDLPICQQAQQWETCAWAKIFCQLGGECPKLQLLLFKLMFGAPGDFDAAGHKPCLRRSARLPEAVDVVQPQAGRLAAGLHTSETFAQIGKQWSHTQNRVRLLVPQMPQKQLQ